MFGLEGLFYILAYPNSKAYWNIAGKIEEVVKESDVDRLIEALHDPETRIRGLISDVIGRKGYVKACDELKQLVDDKYPFVRGLAIRAIGNMKCSGSITVLKRKLKDDSLIFNNSTQEVRDFAAIALAKLNHKDSLPKLQELV